MVEVPFLRDRREDVPLLVQHFSVLFGQEMGMDPPVWTDPAMAVLQAYHFPRNIRELKNIVERALIESAGEEMEPEHLHLRTARTPPDDTAAVKGRRHPSDGVQGRPHRGRR